jgi:hypothetical protein
MLFLLGLFDLLLINQAGLEKLVLKGITHGLVRRAG